MADYNLTAMVRRQKPGMRRKAIIIRDIVPPGVLATDLSQIYAQALDIWTAAIPRIVDEYARTLSAITRDTAEDISNEIGLAEAQFNRLMLVLTPELRRWTVRVERWQRGKWADAVKAATDVAIDMLIGPDDVRETVGATIERNVALVKDVSAQARSRISDSVFRGLNERKPADAVAKEIRDAVDMGRARARRIASDQLSKLSGALADERRREAGLDIWKWRHSGKLHPRQYHKARDGNLYSEVAAQVGREVEGKTVLEAPPADDLPSRPPFCGCRSAAVLVFD